MKIATLRFGKIYVMIYYLNSDFGLSRSITDMKNEDLTEYVVTRYYRAPEIMLSSHEYTKAVDVWSTGCSFGEVLTSKVLFPG